MRISSSIPVFNNGTAVTTGNFDGLHIGHMKLIEKLVSVARARGLTSVILTFEPHPLEFFHPQKKIPRICDLAEMELILQDIGIDCIVRLPFTADIAEMDPTQFWNDVLVDQLKIRFMVIGEDHQFGKARKGTPGVLQRLGQESGVDIIVESHVYMGDSPVSSTRIRRLIEKGSLMEARRLLGHGLFFHGPVLHGAGRGRQLGFPTVNMAFPGRVLPPSGVYVSRSLINSRWLSSISYIGKSPTFDGQTLWLETHIMEGDHDLYDRFLTIDLIEYLRCEIRFSSREELIAQMKADRIEALEFLTRDFEGDS